MKVKISFKNKNTVVDESHRLQRTEFFVGIESRRAELKPVDASGADQDRSRVAIGSVGIHAEPRGVGRGKHLAWNSAIVGVDASSRKVSEPAIFDSARFEIASRGV